MSCRLPAEMRSSAYSRDHSHSISKSILGSVHGPSSTWIAHPAQFLRPKHHITSKSPLAPCHSSHSQSPWQELRAADETQAIHITLQHLYNPALHLVDSSNARSVLATAYTFQGMPELTHHAYIMVRVSLSTSNILDTIQWLHFDSYSPPSSSSPPLPPQTPPGPKFGNFDVSGSDGVATPVSSVGGYDGEEGRYGEWSNRLQQDV